MNKVLEVLNKRLEALDAAEQDALNKINLFDDNAIEQRKRRNGIWDEQSAIREALGVIEATFPAPVDTVDYDGIPF
jgi:hypothetical protein